VQDPVPIWIGGNSRRTLQRVAERAHGWAPLTAPVDISATTRTPHLSINGLAPKIRELHDLAGRAVDVAPAYSDPTISTDVARHRDAFEALEAMGVTWVFINAETSDGVRFVDEFAAHYVR
jgi:alkanesulfonate monooxygenase SsuD/methylene tetrahydromethanopterin reductase-like flavin-dependent oxidoreductase (luciferase family)